jgi:hypothetical protein
MYDNGWGVLKDDKLAVKWFRKSAEQGNASAQYNLGQMFELGQGVAQDNKSALKWYQKSAEQGNESAEKSYRKIHDIVSRSSRSRISKTQNKQPSSIQTTNVPPTTHSEWKPSGSGFYLKGSSHIMTNLHVVGTAKEIRVSFPSGEKYSGEVIVRDVNNDVAIVELQGMSQKRGGFTVDLTADVDPGMEVNAIGYPLNSGISIVSGKISSSTGLNQNISKFTMTAPINEGNSGGPVIDESGNLVGIAQSGLVQRDVENVRFGTKIATTVHALKQAKLSRQFSIQVKRRKRKFSSREIFKKYSPYVVKIDVMK